jgi:hypothetical protein
MPDFELLRSFGAVADRGGIQRRRADSVGTPPDAFAPGRFAHLRAVIAGFDPAIHLLRKTLSKRWIRGSSPRMTRSMWALHAKVDANDPPATLAARDVSERDMA